MVGLVFSSGWHQTVSWPSSVSEGDVAVLVVSRLNFKWDRPSGFVTVGSGPRRTMTPGQINPVVHSVQVMERSLTGSESGVVTTVPSGGIAQLLIFEGTSGIGITRSNTGSISLRAGAAGVMVFVEASSNPSPPLGWSWEGGRGVVSYAGVAVGAYAGWAVAPSGGGTVGGTVGGSWGFGIELLPPDTPDKPRLLEPESGVQVSATADLDLRWLYRPTRSGGYQDAYRLKLNISGVGTRWWNASNGTLASSQVTNSGSTAQVTVPAGLLPAGSNVSWEVDTREALDGEWSGYSDPSTFYPVTPPSVTITGPSGTVNNDLRPEISWSGSYPQGVQTAFRAEIVRGGDTVWRSGVVSADDLAVRPGGGVDWERQATYTARVQVQQTGGSWSNWAQSTFTVTWDLPAEPTIDALPGAGFVPGSSVSYRWVGAPGASVSERVADGTVVARNLIHNGSFEYFDGSNVPVGWEATDGTVESADVSGQDPLLMWAPYGGFIGTRVALLVGAVPGGEASITSNPFPVTAGEWAAVSALAADAFGHSENIGVSIQWLDSQNALVGEVHSPWQSGTEPDGVEVSFAAEAPPGAVSATITLTFRVPPEYPNSVPGGFSDAVRVDVAATEGEALARVATYFDGDTPDVVGPLGPEGVTVKVGTSGGSVTDVEVERGTATGGWERILDFTPSGDDSFQDVFAAYGIPTVWRARTVADFQGMRLTSDWVESAPATNFDTGCYVASAVDPIRTWQRVKIRSDSEHVRQRPTAVAYGLGDPHPRVTYGTYRGRAGQLVLSNVLATDDTPLDRLLALLEAGETLILRWPPEGYANDLEDAGCLVFSVADPLVTGRLAQVAVIKGRDLDVPWVEQESPTVGESFAPTTHPITTTGQ